MAVVPPAMSFPTSQKGKVPLRTLAMAPARAWARPLSSASSAIEPQGTSPAAACVLSLRALLNQALMAATITAAARMGTRRLLREKVDQLRQGWGDLDAAVKPLTVLIEATICPDYSV